MVMVLVVLAVFWLCYVALSASDRTDFPWKQRRSHFSARVVIACLAGPLCLAAIAAPTLLLNLPETTVWPIVLTTSLASLPAAALAPALYFAPGPSSDTPDDGEDDGGSPPDTSPSPPSPRGGGIPLPDADQSRTRARDHRPKLRRASVRRHAREPSRPSRVRR